MFDCSSTDTELSSFSSLVSVAVQCVNQALCPQIDPSHWILILASDNGSDNDDKEGTTIFVKNLNFDTTEENLKEVQ